MHSILFPIIAGLKFIFEYFYILTSNYGISLLLLSITTSILMSIMKRVLNFYPQREELFQKAINPQLEKINRESSGEERHIRMMKLYRRYSYHPMLALRSAVPLLIQLPFLLSAFYLLNNFDAFHRYSFGPIIDLSKPDKLIFLTNHITYALNLLPILMTVINIISTLLTPTFNSKARIQAISIALFLFLLLYKSSSALLIYWTMNNFIFMIGALISRIKYTYANKHRYNFSLLRVGVLVRHSFQSHNILYILRCFFSLFVLYFILLFLAGTKDLFILRQTFPYFLFSLGVLFTSLFITLQDLKRGKKVRLSLAIQLVLVLSIAVTLLRFGIAALGSESSLRTLFYVFTSTSVVLLLMNIADQLKTGFSLKQHFSPLLVVVVYSLSPALYLARMNPDYLNGILYLYYFLVIVGFSILTYFWVYLFLGLKERLYTNTAISALFSITLISLPLIRNYFAVDNSDYFDFIFLTSIVFLYALYVNSKEKFNNLRVIGFSLFTIFLIGLIFFSKEYQAKSSEVNADLPKLLNEVEFTTSPNIYLFVYDAVPNLRTFKNLDIASERLESIFQKYDFKLYDDTYSLGSASLVSMAGTLNIENPGKYFLSYCREVYAGNSVVNNTLRKSGYKTYSILDNFYTGSINSDISTRYEFLYPPREKMINSDQDFMVVLLKGIFQGELKFDIEGVSSEEFSEENMIEEKRRIIEQPKTSTFVVNHCSFPSHTTNCGVLTEQDRIDWLERFDHAMDIMEGDFKTIAENDPNSITIAVSDHGPYLTGDGIDLKGWNKEDITPELIWDRIGTMVAIRWPDKARAEKYDKSLIINQDIFPVVFSYLADDDKYLSLSPAKTFNGFNISFVRGKILD